MSVFDRLLANYTRQLRLLWAPAVPGKQRVWFVVYPPTEERRIRARLPEFEAITLEARHPWIPVDLTRLLPEWLAAHKYRDSIFKEPLRFKPGAALENLAAEAVRAACTREEAGPDSVVVILGLGSLFDFIRVSSLIDKVEDSIRGRLLVFFPGEYQRDVYRFMDARDGFNYMAVPITSTESFLAP